MQEVCEGFERLNITATNATLTIGTLLGVFVSSSSAGTLKFADGKGTIANTFSAAAATFYRLPCRFQGTLTVTVGGTLDATIFYKL